MYKNVVQSFEKVYGELENQKKILANVRDRSHSDMLASSDEVAYSNLDSGMFSEREDSLGNF